MSAMDPGIVESLRRTSSKLGTCSPACSAHHCLKSSSSPNGSSSAPFSGRIKMRCWPSSSFNSNGAEGRKTPWVYITSMCFVIRLHPAHIFMRPRGACFSAARRVVVDVAEAHPISDRNGQQACAPPCPSLAGWELGHHQSETQRGEGVGLLCHTGAVGIVLPA